MPPRVPVSLAGVQAPSRDLDVDRGDPPSRTASCFRPPVRDHQPPEFCDDREAVVYWFSARFQGLDARRQHLPHLPTPDKRDMVRLAPSRSAILHSTPYYSSVPFETRRGLCLISPRRMETPARIFYRGPICWQSQVASFDTRKKTLDSRQRCAHLFGDLVRCVVGLQLLTEGLDLDGEQAAGGVARRLERRRRRSRGKPDGARTRLAQDDAPDSLGRVDAGADQRGVRRDRLPERRSGPAHAGELRRRRDVQEGDQHLPADARLRQCDRPRTSEVVAASSGPPIGASMPTFVTSGPRSSTSRSRASNNPTAVTLQQHTSSSSIRPRRKAAAGRSRSDQCSRRAASTWRVITDARARLNIPAPARRGCSPTPVRRATTAPPTRPICCAPIAPRVETI